MKLEGVGMQSHLYSAMDSKVFCSCFAAIV